MSETTAWVVIAVAVAVVVIAIVLGITNSTITSSNNNKQIAVECVKSGGTWVSTTNICVNGGK